MLPYISMVQDDQSRKTEPSFGVLCIDEAESL